MHNLILTTIVFLTTSIAEIVFFASQKASTTVPYKNFIGLFVILLIFSFIKKKAWRIMSMNMVLGFSFLQMMHIQFYGMPVYPNAIYLFFTESSEVFDTLIQSLSLFLIPLLLVIPGLALNIFTDKKAIRLKGNNYLHFLFIFYFIYNPARTYMTGNTWGRQPSTQEFMGTNIYLSLSYFSGRILPHKLFNKEIRNSYKPEVDFTKTKPFDGNIIFVLGESLSSNHLSLFNYKRATTPYLDSLKQNKNFIFRKGVSSGVSTDISIAMLMNTTYGLRASEDILSGKRCLFNLAKQSNFETHFYSSQSQQQLRYITNSICLTSINEYKSLDGIQPNIDNVNKADDLKLIDLLPDSDEKINKQFYVLHQRGSHSPYDLRYPKEHQKFKPSQEYRQSRIDHYDNTVVNFDFFMKKLITKISKYKKPTIVIYVSDHGEGLGEEGVWGHAALKKPSIQIPMLFFQVNSDLEILKKIPQNPTHFNISLLISNLLGHKIEQDLFISPMKFQVLGNDIDGFAGFLETTFKDGKLISILRSDI